MSRRIAIGNLGPAAVAQARDRYAATVGGRDAIEYVERAQRHRPTDPDAIAREVRRLAATGLRPGDVAAALRIALPVVLEALRVRS